MSLIQMLERFELLSCSLLAAQATSRERFKGAQGLLPAASSSSGWVRTA
jgi:hypothetical protein